MDPTPKTLDPEGKTKPFHIPNGALKKHHHARPPPPAAADLLYRECLKNHAAAIGGHALDGCGEFMPSPTANPADPTSLKCAACGCHRNFHRRLLDPHHGVGEEGQDEMDGHGEDDDDEEHEDTDDRHHRSSSSPPAYLSSAPHMLLALSAGLPGAAPTSGPNPGRPITPQSAPAPSLGPPQPRLSVTPVTLAAGVLPRKRFRTKFSSEQKERMQELSEKLGWRMQKRDEGIVEECCKEIGVGKGVFKVWMHNNKHNFLGPTRRSDGSGGDGGAGGGGGGGEVGGGGGGGIEGNDNGNGNNSHVVNGSSSSS